MEGVANNDASNGSHNQNRNDEERIKFKFRNGIDDLLSLDSDEVLSLIALVAYLLKTRGTEFLIGVGTDYGRIKHLIIFGSSDVALERLDSVMGFYTHPDMAAWPESDFHRSHLYQVECSDSHVQNPKKFPHLELLELYMSYQPFESVSTWMSHNVLPKLKRIEIGDPLLIEWDMNFAPFLSWITPTNLPHLEQLRLRSERATRMSRDEYAHQFRNYANITGINISFDEWFKSATTRSLIRCMSGGNPIINFFVLLWKLDARVTQKLDHLTIDDDYGLIGYHLIILFTEILPRLKKLTDLSFKVNYETNPKEVFEEIIREKAATPATTSEVPLTVCGLLSTCECINFPTAAKNLINGSNGDQDVAKLSFWDDDAFRESLLRFFTCFNTIFIGNDQSAIPLQYRPEFNYAMIKNFVGHRLLKYNNGGSMSRKRKWFFSGQRKSSIPAGIWPIVLERAQTKEIPNLSCFGSSKGLRASGIYCLLREGPILLERDIVHSHDRKRLKTSVACDRNDSRASITRVVTWLHKSLFRSR